MEQRVHLLFLNGSLLLIFKQNSEYACYVVDVLEFHEVEIIFVAGNNLNSLFSNSKFHGKILAIRLKCFGCVICIFILQIYITTGYCILLYMVLLCTRIGLPFLVTGPSSYWSLDYCYRLHCLTKSLD